MRPFLGINTENDETSSSIEGEEFLVIRAEDSEEQETDKKEKETEKYQSPLSPTMKILKMISGALTVALVFLIFWMYRSGSTTLFGGIITMPIVIVVCVIFLSAWMFTTATETYLDVKHSAEIRATEIEEEITDDTEIDLNIPEDAASVDLLAFNYVMENGEPTPVMASDESSSEYFNCPMSLFADTDRFYLTSLDEKYAFDLASVKGIRCIKKTVAVPDWNKDTPPTKGEYKQYGMTVDNLNRIIIPSYCILELEHNGETWGIYFPIYELPSFEKKINIKA